MASPAPRKPSPEPPRPAPPRRPLSSDSQPAPQPRGPDVVEQGGDDADPADKNRNSTGSSDPGSTRPVR